MEMRNVGCLLVSRDCFILSILVGPTNELQFVLSLYGVCALEAGWHLLVNKTLCTH